MPQPKTGPRGTRAPETPLTAETATFPGRVGAVRPIPVVVPLVLPLPEDGVFDEGAPEAAGLVDALDWSSAPKLAGATGPPTLGLTPIGFPTRWAKMM